jgi:hypothetical protein
VPTGVVSPDPELGGASLLLSGQFGVPALGDVSPPASRIPVVRWRIFNDSHELMVSDPPRMQLCVPTNPLSRSRTSQRSEHRGRYVETTVATDDEPSETMPFVIPLDRRSSTGNPTSAVASHQPGQLSFDPLRKRMVDRKPADVSKLLQEWCPRSRTTTRDDQFLRRFLVYRLRCTDACTSLSTPWCSMAAERTTHRVGLKSFRDRPHDGVRSHR